jgi:iron complex outermembrane receptor protein
MSWGRYFKALVLLACCLVSLTVSARVEKSLTWLQDLAQLQNLQAAGSSAQQAEVVRIRAEVENWLKLNPSSKINLAPAPPSPWTAVQTSALAEELRATVETILKEDPDHPFHLGATQINVAESISMLSPISDSISQTEINNRDAINVAKAIDYLPGVDIQHTVGARNEMKYWIRGFSSSGQAPIYLDGIPISVVYDGNIDLARFLTSDIAEIQVSRGIASALLGPNAMGGAINLVTKEPSKRIEGDTLMGTGSGNALLSSLRLGTRSSRYFAQGTLD